MPTTLYEYYKSQGKPLPSVAERAPLAAQYGITNYTGTAEQNTALLTKLTTRSGQGLPADSLPPGGLTPPQDTAAKTTGDLGNLRIALRSALSEASDQVSASRLQQMSGMGLLEGDVGSPSFIKAAIGLAQQGLRQTQEGIFGDIMAGYKDATEARQKEIDRINELREEYGSLVPSNITDLKTALDLVAPAVDRERKLKLEKMATDQAEDNDIESWATSFAKGEVAIGNVPAKIRTAVKVAADKIKTKLEIEATEEYKNRIALRLEKKISEFEAERTLVLQDDNLTVPEQRMFLDYIDTLEQQQKAAKAKGGKGFFSFLNPQAESPAPQLSAPMMATPRTNYTPPTKETFKDIITPFKDLYNYRK